MNHFVVKVLFPPTLSYLSEQAAPGSDLALRPHPLCNTSAMLLQRAIKGRVGFSFEEKRAKLFCVADRKIAGVAFAEQADVSRDARSEHRHADAQRLANHVRAAAGIGRARSRGSAHSSHGCPGRSPPGGASRPGRNRWRPGMVARRRGRCDAGSSWHPPAARGRHRHGR